MNSFPYTGAVHGLYDIDHVSSAASETGDAVSSIAAKLGLKVPNLAPELDELEVAVVVEPVAPHVASTAVHPEAAAAGGGPAALPMEPVKKKYAKEAWPGKKPVHSFLV